MLSKTKQDVLVCDAISHELTREPTLYLFLYSDVFKIKFTSGNKLSFLPSEIIISDFKSRQLNQDSSKR